MTLHPRLIIDLAEISENYRLLSGQFSGSDCAAVVKANAYGIGSFKVTTRLLDAGCRTFFVAHGIEAAEIIEAVNAKGGRVFVLHGSGVDLPEKAIPVITNLLMLQSWRKHSPYRDYALHLDTGMNRLGLSEGDDARALDMISHHPPCMIISHLACADEPQHPLNARQLDYFQRRAAHYPPGERSFVNSAGCFLASDYHFDVARPGLALYGGQPVIGQHYPLKVPYLLEAPVLQVRRVFAGDSFGYGATHVSKQDGWAATLGIGYADGLPRAFSNCGKAYLDGLSVPIIGRVSMDSCVVDISAHGNPQGLQDKWAQIYGPDLTLESQAEATGISPYEMLTRVTGRTQRAYI